MNKCACGCGGFAKTGNRFINGHNKPTLGLKSKFKGKSHIERFGEERAHEISIKIRESKLGDKNPACRPEVKTKISKNRKGLLIGNDNPKYWLGKKNLGQSDRMKSNNPAHRIDVKEKSRKRMLKRWDERGNVKIGANEKKLLDYIESIIGVEIERQHPVIGYAVDGYIPQLNMIIEIDEKHHYDRDGNLRKRDMKRQQLITESLNCSFIRVRDDVSRNKIKEIFEIL